jgi:hypothetical protein
MIRVLTDIGHGARSLTQNNAGQLSRNWWWKLLIGTS